MMSKQVQRDAPAASRVIQPGATIGMVGGGQLGRMFAIAAAKMGYRVVVFCQDQDAPAAQVATSAVVAPMEDQASVNRFARQCDVITLEFENIAAETIELCGRVAPTYPSAHVLATAQDRYVEKSTFRDAGLPVTPFVEVHDAETLSAAGQSLGWPMIVKTCRSGYDGKGQHRVDSPTDVNTVAWETTDRWIAEKFIPFEREVSVIVARTVNGQTKCFPVFENLHRNHILDVTVAPADIDSTIADDAMSIATTAAETLGVVGLLCVEMFVVAEADGNRLLINEVAPRPHNSGHLTIEACKTSQFEQHVRAVCGLPLGETDLVAGAGAMVNVLGDLWNQHGEAPPWHEALAVDGVRLHLYGKSKAKRGRKMGHLTATGRATNEARERVASARAALQS